MSFNQAELDELHKLADNVAARGTQVDSQIAGFIKGGTTALRDLAMLVGLVKGAKMGEGESAKDDETEDEDPNTEESKDNAMEKGAESGTEEGMDKGDMSCGEGMEKGAEGAAAAVVEAPAAATPTATDGGYIDATELVKGVEGRVVALQLELAEERKTSNALREKLDAQGVAIEQQSAMIKGLEGTLSRLVDATAAMGDAFSSSIGAMTKGISTSLDAMRKPVVEVKVPDVHAAGQVGRFAGEADLPVAPGALTKGQLFKGVQERLISDSQVQLYQRAQRFLNDDTENAKLIARIAQL